MRKKFSSKFSRANRSGRCPRTNKIQYPTIDDAKQEAKNLRKLVGSKVHPYLCTHCAYWHNGHNRPPERRKELA